MQIVHKLVRWVALVLAILIIGCVIGLVVAIPNFLISKDYGEVEKLNIENKIFNEIKLDISSSKINIYDANSLEVHTNNDTVKVSYEDNKLIIKDKKRRFLKRSNSTINIYLPSYELENIDFNIGAGNIKIDSLKSNKFNFKFGAGSVKINKLIVNKKANIEGGAGELVISDSIINNMKFEAGVGASEISGKILGNSKISSGIGEVTLNIFDNVEDYKITSNSGIGTVKVNNKEIKSSFGIGQNIIDLDLGIGNVDINFK